MEIIERLLEVAILDLETCTLMSSFNILSISDADSGLITCDASCTLIE